MKSFKISILVFLGIGAGLPTAWAAKVQDQIKKDLQAIEDTRKPGDKGPILGTGTFTQDDLDLTDGMGQCEFSWSPEMKMVQLISDSSAEPGAIAPFPYGSLSSARDEGTHRIYIKSWLRRSNYARCGSNTGTGYSVKYVLKVYPEKKRVIQEESYYCGPLSDGEAALERHRRVMDCQF